MKSQTTPKPKLKATVVPVFRVLYQDLEQYIREVFGFEYDFLFATGIVNGMVPEYKITGVIPPTMAKQVKDLQRGQRTRNLLLILNVLVADGYIPAGTYIIDTHKRPSLTDVYRDLLLRTRDPLAPECQSYQTRHETTKSRLTALPPASANTPLCKYSS